MILRKTFVVILATLIFLSGAVFVIGSALDKGATDDGGITLIDSTYPSGYSSSISSISICAGLNPCEGNNFLNNNYIDNIMMGGPMVSINWTPSSSVTISRIEVFTGERVGTNALAIWSDDGGTPGKPQVALGYTRNFTTVLTNSWQGADLITPVSVTAGTKYWVIWDPEDGDQASITDDPAGIQQTYWGSDTGTVSGGANWFGPFSDHRWKFRIFCEKPVVSISTDKSKYSPGDTMTVNLNIENPTSNPVDLEWYIGVPQSNKWVTKAKASIPAGYNTTHTISIPVGNWGSTPLGLVHYVHLLDPVTKDVLAQDAALLVYSPIVTNAPQVDLTEDIMKQRVKLPN